MKKTRKKIGFIVNPIAGMGGSVGLKGTDGDAYFKALERGATPISPERALLFLNNVKSSDFEIYSAAGVMGEYIVEKSIHRDRLIKVIGERKQYTTREDTINTARLMKNDVDIVVFVGGDGTARDIYTAIGTSIPVIGVPSGVKMYSSVFAVSPQAAARILDRFIEENHSLEEREVLDIDEESYRRDQLVIRLYGYLLTPLYTGLVQSSKVTYDQVDEEIAKEAIAEYVVESMEPDTPYILGPGSTVKSICRKLRLDCTLLGVDVLFNGKIIVKDAWERDLLDVVSRYRRVKLIISPIGGQGFLLGRGNQQISPRVLSHINREDIIIVATERKIRELRELIIDTGDSYIDSKLEGYLKVIVDYGKYVVIRVKASSPW